MAIVAQKRDGFSEFIMHHSTGGRLSAFLLAAFICPAAALAEVVTEPLADHPEWGYTVSGLGEDGDETAVVFTNYTETATWTVPTDLTDVQFLVVGGGGGGGGGLRGPGGGGGGVVTGVVHTIAKNAVISAKVGSGGSGGSTTNSKGGSSTDGSSSYIAVDGSVYVTANGGGKAGSQIDGGSGGSGGGGGAYNSSRPGGADTKGSIGENVSGLVSYEMFGNAGGSGKYHASGKAAAGGGGGAGADGTDGGGTSSKPVGGNGGEGLPSDITGNTVVYGSGGGGGASGGTPTQGKGGTGAGNAAGPGGAASANQGGGGGGASTATKGGAGGSGIVVLRYAVAANVAVTPGAPASKIYTGETLTADVADGTGYTVTQNNGGIDVGDYDVVLTLADGYTWDDSEFSGTLTFSITQAANVWTVEPAITKNSWTHGAEEPGVLTAGETQFGSVVATIAKDGGAATAFDGMLPTEAGEYVVTYATAATANYTAPEVTEKSVSFTIYAADAIPPYALSTGTLSVNGERTLSVPYSLACDVTTTKTADIYVRYALDGADTTNTVQIATGVALGGGNGTGTVADLKPGATYWVDAYAVVDEEQSDATTLESVSVPGPATGLAASATFTNDPKEFIISGLVTPGLGTTIVTVEWSLNSDALDSRETFTFSYGDDGVFSNVVSYAELSDSLTWRVSVSNTVTTGTWGEQTFTGETAFEGTKIRKDSVNTVYTWTGAGGDNLWTNIANWSASASECIGYPGTKAKDGYERSTALFTSAANGAVIDLDGGSFIGRDGGESIKFDANAGEIKFVNGTLDFNSSNYKLGASGTTIVFENVAFDGDLTFASGATVVFEGETTGNWAYKPLNGQSNTKLVVRDGRLSSGAFSTSSTIASTHTVEISNAVWSINGKVDPDQAIAGTVIFRDGADRQARFVASGELQLKGTYDIAIPQGGHSVATLTGSTLTSGASSSTFKIDVTDFTSGKKVPIVTFTSKTDQSSKYETKTVNLVAMADGVDVTAKRNAQLVWSSEDNTLYYQQDSKNGLVIVVQ